MSWPLETVAVAVPFAARNSRVVGGVFCAPRAPRYSQGAATEVGQPLPRRRPAKTLAGTVVEKRVDALELSPANSSEG